MGQILTDIPIQETIYSDVMAAVEACSASAAAVATLPKEQPRPEQGGERITEDWLYSLSDGECLWRFR